MGTMDIRSDDLSHPAIHALLREHLANMAMHSPAESIHALDIEALRNPDVSFWSAWSGAELLGCGALLELDSFHGEIKSMRTSAAHRRQGVAATMLVHLIDVATHRGYTRLSLETGSMEAFAPARAMYARFGFVPCRPFASYVDDRNSVFMTRLL
jgi:putative acetyltransferase